MTEKITFIVNGLYHNGKRFSLERTYTIEKGDYIMFYELLRAHFNENMSANEYQQIINAGFQDLESKFKNEVSSNYEDEEEINYEEEYEFLEYSINDLFPRDYCVDGVKKLDNGNYEIHWGT